MWLRNITLIFAPEMTAKRPSELTGADGVKVFLFTETAGPAAALGHWLKLEVQQFRMLLRDSAELAMSSAHFAVSSIVCVCARSNKGDEPSKLSGCDKLKITNNTISNRVLDAKRYPFAHFDVVVDETDRVEGNLYLKGRGQYITCSKTWTDTHVSVKCPIHQNDFGMVPYNIMGGALAVGQTVGVEVLIPRNIPGLPII